MFLKAMIIGLFLLSNADVMAKQKQITVAYYHFPPYISIEDDTPVSGLIFDMIQELLKRMQLKEIQTVCSFKRCILDVSEGRIDLMPAALIFPERKKHLQFFNTPTPNKVIRRFIVPKGLSKTIRQYEDLYGKSILVHRGGSVFKRFDDDDKLDKYNITHWEQMIEMVALGRADVVAGDALFSEYYIQTHNLQDRVEAAEYVFDKGLLGGHALSKKSDFLSRIDDFNRTYLDMKRDGTIRKIWDKYGVGKIYDHELGLTILPQTGGELSVNDPKTPSKP